MLFIIFQYHIIRLPDFNHIYSQKKCWKPIFPALFSGPDGNRTRVQKPIPCSSTIIVRYFSFPPPDENEHSPGFGSFILRPHAQSFAYVVSYKLDAWVLMCRSTRSDGRLIKQRMLNFLQRLYLSLPFNALHADSFTSCKTPVETSTSPCTVAFTVIIIYCEQCGFSPVPKYLTFSRFVII